MADAADEDCPGPHRECQACSGQQVEFRETLYVPATGRPQGVAAPHRCWHCKGRGYYCQTAERCTAPHD